MYAAVMVAIFGASIDSIKDQVDETIGFLAITSVGMFFAVLSYARVNAEKEYSNHVATVEQEVAKNPEKAAPAWELARLNLERYLLRNLGQVTWIFALVVIAMIAGFGIILFGVVRLYASPADVTPALIAAASGILTQFIAATFLFIYKSTLAQAKDYVGMLERINAVGMSMQILDSLEGDAPELKNKAKVEIAHELLRFYGQRPASPIAQ